MMNFFNFFVILRMPVPNADSAESSSSGDNMELYDEFLRACMSQDSETAATILNQPGFDVKQVSHFHAKGAPLFQACWYGLTEVVKLLLKHPNIDVNQTSYLDGERITPLGLACEKGHTEVVALLLEHSNIEVNPKWNKTPLYRACFKGHINVVTALLRHPDTDVNQPDYFYGRGPLYKASEWGRQKIVNQLLKHHDIDVNQVDKFKTTPLCRACERGSAGVVEQLLGHPAIDVNRADNEERAPLTWACKTSRIDIVLLLLQQRSLIIPAEDDFIQPYFNRILQSTLETDDEAMKKSAVLLYLRGFKPEDPDNNNLYQNWQSYHERVMTPNETGNMLKNIKKSQLKSAKGQIPTLHELCIFAVSKQRVNVTEFPALLLSPPQPLIDTLNDFISGGGFKINQQRLSFIKPSMNQ